MDREHKATLSFGYIGIIAAILVPLVALSILFLNIETI